MFDTYTEIFNQRGQLYHQAMLEFPLARQEEFKIALSTLDLRPHSILCDVPSGGGYLVDFLHAPDIKVYSVEISKAFAREMSDRPENTTILCKEITQLPIVEASLDYVLSLAGLHHVATPKNFFRETYRILNTCGVLVVADVLAGSTVDYFLNVFVDRHSSMGHKGKFLSAQTYTDIESCGFEIERVETRAYQWKFPTSQAMVHYCRMLFGINQATDEQILEGIRTYLGVHESDSACNMNWELTFIRAKRSQ